MVPVNLLTLLSWTVGIIVGVVAIILVATMLSLDESTALERLVPPEIWPRLSPAARASFRVLAKADEATRDRFKKVLLRLAEGYLQERRSPVAQQAYVAALLETLGKFTL